MFGREFKNLLTIRNLKSSKLAESSDFGLEFALWLNSLRDYEFGILNFFSDLAPKLRVPKSEHQLQVDYIIRLV